MERSTFSGDNSVPFRIRISLLSNLMLLYESLTAYAGGKNGITSCLPTIHSGSKATSTDRAFLGNLTPKSSGYDWCVVRPVEDAMNSIFCREVSRRFSARPTEVCATLKVRRVHPLSNED